jgi:hypothetical protein
MLYWLEVYALLAALIFAGAGAVILSLLVWREGKAYAAARYRINKRVWSLMTRSSLFANPLAISRSFSRSDAQAQPNPRKIQ